jgi:hypothetical protein
MSGSFTYDDVSCPRSPSARILPYVRTSLPTIPQRRASAVAHGQDTVSTALGISVHCFKLLSLLDQELIVCK